MENRCCINNIFFQFPIVWSSNKKLDVPWLKPIKGNYECELRWKTILQSYEKTCSGRIWILLCNGLRIHKSLPRPIPYKCFLYLTLMKKYTKAWFLRYQPNRLCNIIDVHLQCNQMTAHLIVKTTQSISQPCHP